MDAVCYWQYSSDLAAFIPMLHLFSATPPGQITGGDYVRTNLRVMLNANATSQCVSITLVDDTIVEAAERFLVQVEQILSSDDLTFGLDPEFTEITIVDNDGTHTLFVLYK